MKPAEMLKETPTLKKLSECALVYKDDNSFIFHQHLLNIKRLILEIKYENIEKVQLKKFFHDLDQFVLDKLGKNKNCKEIIKDWYHNFDTPDPSKPEKKKGPNHFSAFFPEGSKYACQGRIIPPNIESFQIEVSKIISKKDLIEHYIEPNHVEIAKDLDKVCNAKTSFIRSLLFIIFPKKKDGCANLLKRFAEMNPRVRFRGRDAFFVFKKLPRSVKDKGVDIGNEKHNEGETLKKLYRIGIVPYVLGEESYFIMHFSSPEMVFYTPTSFDVQLDQNKYFLPKQPEQEGKGHWGETLSLIDMNEKGLPEAVIKEGDYRMSQLEIEYVGAIKKNSPISISLFNIFKENFLSFVENLEVSYNINITTGG